MLLPKTKRWGRYRIRIDDESLVKQSKLIADLMRRAYDAAS
jgi:hypothetical protein